MPFGWGSTWDFKLRRNVGILQMRVTNAFRLGVHLGRGIKIQGGFDECYVTNAFRLGVHLGPRTGQSLGSQTVKSPMPFGWGSTWDSVSGRRPRRKQPSSPMPFGWGSTWDGMRTIFVAQQGSRCHQCLSAGGPLGTHGRRMEHARNSQTSPMPFGWGSTWDCAAVVESCVKGLKSPMPFGWGSTWDRRDLRA